MQALAANPVTASYSFAVVYKNGRYVLRGRVGTKAVHDVAVRVANSLGYAIGDELVIDTAEVYRAMARAASAVAPLTAALGPVAGAAGPMVGSPWGLNSYIYPPPLFGRYDDPFFGLEPPVISYPPWWSSVVYRPPLDPNYSYPIPPVGSNPPLPAGAVAGGGAQAGAAPAAPAGSSAAAGSAPTDGTIEMTIDPRGVATLKGTVPTLADRIAVGQRLAQTPGVAEVQNLLTVREATTPGADAPPPPPTPAPPAGAAPRDRARPPVVAPEAPPAGPVPTRREIPVDEAGRNERVSRAMNRRPALSGLAIKTSVREGIAYLSGRVPSAYEAMLAFRAAQQTPGVREVDDRLEFVVPSAESKNPLIEKGRPDDVEPYLEAQIRRQLGDAAHVDRVRVHGSDRLEIRGTLVRAEDGPRVEAILRSMPLLRGFRVDPEFQPE